MFVVTLNIRAEEQVKLHVLQSNMHFLFLMRRKRVHRYAQVRIPKLLLAHFQHCVSFKGQSSGHRKEHGAQTQRGQRSELEKSVTSSKQHQINWSFLLRPAGQSSDAGSGAQSRNNSRMPVAGSQGQLYRGQTITNMAAYRRPWGEGVS